MRVTQNYEKESSYVDFQLNLAIHGTNEILAHSPPMTAIRTETELFIERAELFSTFFLRTESQNPNQFSKISEPRPMDLFCKIKKESLLLQSNIEYRIDILSHTQEMNSSKRN